MTRDDLLAALSSTMKKTKVQELAALAGADKLPVQELLDLCFLHKQPAIAFRAAWVLEHIEVYFPELFLPILPTFLKRLAEQSNYSCQRHFTKILMHLSSLKASMAYKDAFAALADHEQVVEVIFDWLINPATPVAVRVNCLEVLFNLSTKFNWLKTELLAQTEYYLRDGSPAMQSRGRKLVQQLQKQARQV
ncbi:hypothetical protein [uncultured Pontibacter sp.]|uniref:hypothetical protein n=1 Tax=uncultured Pontibacter sp. TaxID=453356 RepID=UPI00262F253F|nr:hypothetical protein [uncultured Pontibacter sp.]